VIYNISSENLNNPVLKDLLKELSCFFNPLSIDFYVIGAMARDIILSNLHDFQPYRKTVDLDIAITIPDWSQFDIIERKLTEMEVFKKSKDQKQRFIYKDVYIVDIVPFGDVAKDDGNIYWPPDGTIAMSVLGFLYMANAAIAIDIDHEFTIKVSSLPGLFLLKIIAWKDRHFSGTKDAYDLALILSNYLDINSERAIDEHYDLYEDDKFDRVVAGARLIARDIKQMTQRNERTLKYMIGILMNEIVHAEESLLINQLIESDTRLQYEQVFDSLESILIEWEL